METLGIMGIVFFLVFLICLPIARKEKKVIKERQTAMASVNCHYDKASKTLFIFDRAPEYRQFLLIREHKTNSYDYVEPSYQYTSVSVGGVTTGGISKSGDYYKSKEYVQNYTIIYPGKEDFGEVEWISLSPELLSLARISEINKYIENDKIRVVDDVKIPDAYVLYSKMGMMDKSVTYYNMAKAAAYPSKEKCESIIKWLCGRD